MTMRNKLQKFTEFTNRLLPHETQYLLSVEQFEDEVKLGILKLVDYNCRHINQFIPYDTSIDKRKYSLLKSWIETRLSAIDVDESFEWMNEMERKIMTDSVQMREEKKLLKAIRNYEYPGFFFTKFYELVEFYRHFLLIRMRYADHKLTEDFLNTHREAYERSKRIMEQMHQATSDIVKQYSGNSAESIQWEAWLTRIFYDEHLDGFIRYLALVRLTFISFNYRKFDMLPEKYDYLDEKFGQGLYYSKRLLLNYYSNRLMLHSHFREYDKAVYYGYLSIREKTHDYIHYVNNLCAVLLRLKRHQEALQLMRQASPEMKVTKNFHTKVGFVAFYVEALNKNGQYKNAENYADSFLTAFAKEVLQYRWHLFFSVYFEALVRREQFQKLLKIARKYKLLEKDKNYQAKASYLPTIPWYVEIAKYKEGMSSRKEVTETFQAYIDAHLQASDKLSSLRNTTANLQAVIPEILQNLDWKSVGANP